MDAQVKAGSLVRTIAENEILLSIAEFNAELASDVVDLIRDFVSGVVSAAGTFNLENLLANVVGEFARKVIQWLVSNLEPEILQMPGTVKHNGDRFRRLPEKTQRSNVVTSFGEILFSRARYRQGRDGKTIFPLELLLGLENGFTPAAADLVGKHFATSGSTQGRTREMARDRFGISLGNEKLRKLTRTLTTALEPLREETQVAELMNLIEQARKGGGNPVLSVSRDGVALGLAPWSFFEMAGVACISVLSEGNKLGTVYLGRTPESNQESLSRDLTSLLAAVVKSCGEDIPGIVYVSDAGKIETAYWKNVLRKFFVDGRRIRITRVVDYYHASERLTIIANALKLDPESRADWLSRARGLLLEPNGHGRVMRSIAKMKSVHGYKSSQAGDAAKAEKYLRRYKRFMEYAGARAHHYPIGSGVVESACKQIVSERMKLSGMRWHREGCQQVMTLRCILLSKIWSKVYEKWLQSKPTVTDLMPKANS